MMSHSKRRILLVFLLLAIAGAPRASVAQDLLTATEILGRPTDRSVTLNAVAPFDAEAYIDYGTTSGVYAGRTDTMAFTVGTPIEITVGGLLPDTRYYYRFCYRRTGTVAFTVRD